MDSWKTVFRYQGTKDPEFREHFALTELAYETAFRAHEGQCDKSGRAYIYHPLSVCYILSGVDPYEEALLHDDFFTTPIELEDIFDCDLMTTALLHDVLEDTSLSAEDLVSLGFSGSVIGYVRMLTHKKSLRYDLYINSLKGDPYACLLKTADMLHNSNLKRTKEPTKLLKQWRERYIRGVHELWPIVCTSGIRNHIRIPVCEEFNDLLL